MFFSIRDKTPRKRVVAGCVADNNPKYLEQVERLVASWRWFAGSLSAIDFRVCVVEEIPPYFRERYERFGAKVHVVDRFDVRHPPSNKLRFLELPEAQNADWVLLLDCDTIVVQEPSPLFDEKADFVGKPADFPTVTHDIFVSLFEAFGYPLPEARMHCTVSGERTIPYFNAGVLAFSRRAMARLVPEWIETNRRLLGQLELLRERQNFCEQASLALALAKCPVATRVVGNEMNFPAHCTDQPPESAFGRTDPVIIHYHWLTDAEGYLLPSPYPSVQARIARFNERFRAERRRHFDNRNFWNRRYRQNPQLGSGHGSRGLVAEYKRELLRQVVEVEKPRTVLDVGCGDLEIGSVLPPQGYVGVDVAEEIVSVNSTRHLERRFVCGDPLTLPLEPADLTVCLDVCIHQPSMTEYRRFVQRLVELTGKTGIVAGFETEPPEPSDITFFWEPLSETLQRAGAREIRKIGAYRQVTVFSFRVGPSEAASLERLGTRVTTGRLQRPVFIVGAMRSGTTLLAELLGQSPDVCHCGFELKDLWSRETGFPMASAKTRDEFCPELRAEDANRATAERLASAFRSRMRDCVDKGKSTDAVFLNKNPHLCNKLPYVDALFPDARFIWIHRHLPQVVASLKRLFADVQRRQGTWHWWPEAELGVRNRCWRAVHSEGGLSQIPESRRFPGGSVRYLAEYWLESNRAVSEFLYILPTTRWLSLAEEDLVREPATQIARCLARLQLPLSRLDESGRAVDRERNAQWPALLTRTEREELRRFVQERAAEVDALFPGEGRAARYISWLEESLAETGVSAFAASMHGARYTTGAQNQ